MKSSDRFTVRLASLLSIAVAVWALLAVAAIPLGAIGGAVAALLALGFGGIALRSQAWGRWRRIAAAGIAISVLALLVFAGEVVFAVFFD